MLIKNGRIITEKEIIEGSIEFLEGRICKIYDEKFPEGEGIDANGDYISPGFIDMHIHAIEGHDTMDGSYESINEMSKSLLNYGVTSFVPTTMTEEISKIKDTVENISEAISKGTEGASIIGIHLEGPFISPDMAGAQDPIYIRKPCFKDFEYIVGKNVNNIKTVTIAPEIEGAKKFAQFLSSLGIVVSAGHTSGTYDDFINGFDTGISHSTHLYNAMTGFHHREPGIVGGIFDTPVSTEIIVDGIHVHYASVRAAVKIKGPENTALISDAMMACGLPDGLYSLGGQDVYVRDGEARLKSGRLAGSTLTLNKAVYNMVKHCGLSICDAVKMASSTPARILKVDDKKGYIKEGYDADIIVFDEDLKIKHVFVKGTKK